MATAKKPSKSSPPKKVKKPKVAAPKKAKPSPKAKVAKTPKAKAAKVVKPKKAPAPKAAKKTSIKLAPASEQPASKTVVVKELPKEELKRRVLALLKEAGTGGCHIKTISEKTGRTINGIYVFFSTTAKNLTSIIKVAPATYALRPEKDTTKP